MPGGATIAVTGAGSGIGRAVAVRLLADDARIFGIDTDGDALTAISELGGDGFVPIVCDVSSPDSVESAFLVIQEESTSLDGLVNAAGIGGEPGDVTKTDMGTWQR